MDLYTISKNQSEKKIFSRKSAFDLNKMNYREFESWWEDRQWYDSALLDSKEIYGIRLSFIPDLIKEYLTLNKITLDEFQLSLKPDYIWSEDLIKFFDYFLDESNEETFWEKPNKYKWYNKTKPLKRIEVPGN